MIINTLCKVIFPFLIARPFQNRPHLIQPVLLLEWYKNHKTARLKNRDKIIFISTPIRILSIY